MYLMIFLIPMIHLSLLNSNNLNNLKKMSLWWSLILLFFSLFLLILYSNFYQFQFFFSLNWLKNYSSYLNWNKMNFSIDSISLLFILLSSLLMPICMLMSWNNMNKFNKEYFMLLFLMLMMLMLMFSILDIFIFFILFETTLIPMFILMGVWGSSEEKVKAAFYFFFYTLMGSLLMLMSIFKIFSLMGSTNYFLMMKFEIPLYYQFWFFLGFILSLSMKIPMIPVHMWLPQAHVEAPLSGSILLAGMLLKLGGYGMMSFIFPLFPMASSYFTPMIIMLSLISMIYGGLTTCSQNDIKKLMAYSSVSHMGLVVLSIFTHSMEGLFGSMMMMLAHGLMSSGLFMSSGVLYLSFHSSMIKYFKGLTMMMPILSSLTLILILSNISFPLTFNFMAELFSLLSAFNLNWMMGVLASIGAFMSIIYSLYLYNSIYFGYLNNYLMKMSEISYFEFNSFLPLFFFTMFLGFYPNYMNKFLMLSSYLNISS